MQNIDEKDVEIDFDVYGFGEEDSALYDTAGSNLLTPPPGAAKKISKDQERTKWSEVFQIRNISVKTDSIKNNVKPGDATATVLLEMEVDTLSTDVDGEPSPNIGRRTWNRLNFNFTQYKADPANKSGHPGMTAMALVAFKSFITALGYSKELGRQPLSFVEEYREDIVGQKVVGLVEQYTKKGALQEDIRSFVPFTDK